MVKNFLLFVAFIPFLLRAQPGDSTQHTEVNTKRLRTVAIAGGLGYGAAMTGLHVLWYKDQPRQSFQFFNDNAEWKQVDKLGHFYSAFYLSYGAASTYSWCGLSPKKSALLGAVTGFCSMLPVEVFDGFSQAYGASTGDLLANAGGTALFLAQTALWNEMRIYPRFSFHRTDFAKIRPDILGDNLTSEILKDYNGQTYWLSFDLDKFFHFPEWLNIAIGYGASDMVYARDTPNREAGYAAYRQYYLSVDPDLRAIRTRSKMWRTVIFIAGMIKLPAPTLEVSKGNVHFHLFY